MEHQCSPRLSIKFWPSPRFEVEEEKILCWENRAPVLPQMDWHIFHKSQIWCKIKRQRSCFKARPLPFLFGQQQSVTMWITQPFQKSPKVVKNRQKLTKIHKNHQTIDKNCTVGQKIELWSHCAPAKSPKIVKNRQKRQKMHSGTEKVGKLNFGPTVHRTVHRVVVLLS